MESKDLDVLIGNLQEQSIVIPKKFLCLCQVGKLCKASQAVSYFGFADLPNFVLQLC